jgi:hypothetical protein
MILTILQSFSCRSCARLFFACWRGLTYHHQSNRLPFNSIPHSINLVHKHVALSFLSPFIIPISSSSSSSCVIKLTSRLLLNCRSWVCQFNLALCNMSFIQFHFWSFIRSATWKRIWINVSVPFGAHLYLHISFLQQLLPWKI